MPETISIAGLHGLACMFCGAVSPPMTDHSAGGTTLAPVREATWELLRIPEAAGHARALTREALSSWGLGTEVDDVMLIVSELVTNAVVHAEAPIELRLIVSDQMLRGEVVDHSLSSPRPVAAALDQEHGRGLAIVDEYSESWGVAPEPTGKAVWFLRSLRDLS
ncbi:ATP-binding protein [Nonomuraea sp. SMC257]|uniref:ATP-binding protein n=1 Tax=Nonomuraea montanisoli TaxID=2741721 RepID=A0A7Y6IDX7_9ACTN|nr:ATP-binding protein [Nonomuraea montanisoli]